MLSADELGGEVRYLSARHNRAANTFGDMHGSKLFTG